MFRNFDRAVVLVMVATVLVLLLYTCIVFPQQVVPVTCAVLLSGALYVAITKDE